MSWNPVLNLVKQIKKEYIEKTGDKDCLNFEHWLETLNKKEYNDIFDSLQIRQRGNIILIRYGVAEVQKGLWEDKNSIYRECRSIVIDLEREELVLTPFRKFFNLNEVEENKLENVVCEIKNATTVEITDKLDGSMQSARFYNGEIFMAGSMAIDRKDSWRLDDGYNKLTENHKKMIKDNPDLTFIFEYISIKDAHVVKYHKSLEGLYLIGIRNTKTGYQLPYKMVKIISNYYKVLMTDIENRTLEDILELSKTAKSHQKEGWVLNIDGHMIKIKCDDYVKLHRVLDKSSSINVVIENIAEDRLDDLLSKIPELYKERIMSSANKIIDYKNETNKKIEKFYKKAPKENRKEFMLWVENNVPLNIKGYVRMKYLGKEFNVLKKEMEKGKVIRN